MLVLLDKDVYYVGEKYPKVSEDDSGIRPAGEPDECFYCHSKVGERHKRDCVVCCKPVRMKAEIDFLINVPNHWSERTIKWHFNHGRWCADNLLEKIAEYEKETGDCLCPHTKIKIVRNRKE